MPYPTLFRSVGSLDKMTQQNVAMVSNMSGIAGALANGAAELEQLVKRFKLNRRKWVREPGSDAATRGTEYRGYGRHTLYLPQAQIPGTNTPMKAVA